MFTRVLQKKILSGKKSVLLLGPRQCGKSTLMKSCSPELSINLARESEFLQFSSNPDEFEDRIRRSRPKSVLIDEVQRLPSLLNTVQAILDDDPRAPKFYLTGSSARKLRRGQANLLPGRVHSYRIGPLTWQEFGAERFSIDELLSTGTLPGILNEQERSERIKTLRDYAGTYLREEIQAEALARDIEGFSRFLKVCAAWTGQFIDLTKISSESQVKRLTAMRYLDILEDTLVVERVGAFSKTSGRRLVQHPKLYFFDVGVWNGLIGNFEVTADRIGLLFEHFMYNQISAAAKAFDLDLRISTFRTEHGAEVDFIIEHSGRIFALELKASKNVGPSDLLGFESFKSVCKKKFTPIVATLGSHAKVVGGVPVLPWNEALSELGLKSS